MISSVFCLGLCGVVIVCRLVLVWVEGEPARTRLLSWQFEDTLGPLTANDNTAWHAYICVCLYVCVCESICVYVFILISILACMELVCALLAISVFVCPTVYGHICISLADAALNFFGVTENDLELLLPVNVSDSGNGSRCVCVYA